MLVKNWMSREVITVDANQSLQEAIRLTKENRINSLPVLDHGNLVGIISDRDLKEASASDATTLDVHELMFLVSKIKVRTVMTPNPITVPPDHTIEEAAAVLLAHRISSLPVLTIARQMVGIITRSDMFKVIISLTGLGKKGIQMAVRLKDEDGEIQRIREVLRRYGVRVISILSSAEDIPGGFRKVYFRFENLNRADLPDLLEGVKALAVVLYVVDHRENQRMIFADA